MQSYYRCLTRVSARFRRCRVNETAQSTQSSTILYMTTHQQSSSQPQHSQASPQEVEMGLGMMMDLMEEVVLPGMVSVG